METDRVQSPEIKIRHVGYRDQRSIITIFYLFIRMAEKVAGEDISQMTRGSQMIIPDDERAVVPDESIFENITETDKIHRHQQNYNYSVKS